MVDLCHSCVVKAYEIGMGIVAMMVIGPGVLDVWLELFVSGFERGRFERLPAVSYGIHRKSIPP